MSIVTDINVMKENSRTLMDYLNYNFVIYFSLARKYKLDIAFLYQIHHIISEKGRKELKNRGDEFSEYQSDLFLRLMLIGIADYCRDEIMPAQLREMILGDAISTYNVIKQFPPLELFSVHDKKLYPALFKKLGQRVRRYTSDKMSVFPGCFIEAIVFSIEVFHSCVVHFYTEVLEKEIPA